MAPQPRSLSSRSLPDEEEGEGTRGRPPPVPQTAEAVAESLLEGHVFSHEASKPPGVRAWTDPCVASNAFILWVSWFLYYCRNLELSLLAMLLFCASMVYHRSGETWFMAVDVALGRTCCLYYIISTSYWSSWSMHDTSLILGGYAAFGIIIGLTTGKQALVAHTDRYTRLHPLVHILGIIPPMVGGIVCKPFIM
mmetsp:Transcript_43491/g.106399  ORF Transcript_43491/g.106399 Transcript_43491/m.106399 type:complete len:195 (-) Transcript_43491:4-588(-)